MLPASQRVAEDMWYAGTADAVYQNMDIIEDYGARYIVILAGDHIYKMDYEMSWAATQKDSSGPWPAPSCIHVPSTLLTCMDIQPTPVA